MKQFTMALLIAFALLAMDMPQTASAHQPREVEGGPVQVIEPEVSKAFYDEQSGTPRTYVLNEAAPFTLYLSLSVPKTSNPDARYSARLYRAGGDRSLVATLDGTATEWTEFFEPFGRDWYLQGPELRQEIASGRYEIEVYGNDNAGKYVLAIGEKEVFSFADVVHSIRLIPKLKVQFFETSPVTFALSVFGAFYLAVTFLLGAALGRLARFVLRETAMANARLGVFSRVTRVAASVALFVLSLFVWSPVTIALAGYLTFEAISGWSPFRFDARLSQSRPMFHP